LFLILFIIYLQNSLIKNYSNNMQGRKEFIGTFTWEVIKKKYNNPSKYLVKQCTDRLFSVYEYKI